MKKVKLKDIANIYNGNSINARVKAEKYCFNVPAWNYIGTKDIDFDGTVNYDTGVKIPFEEKGFKIAPANCVFVCSEGGSAGKKTAHITQEVCFGNKLYAIVNNKNLFVSKYVYYYTRYREFFEQFKALMSGIIGGVSSKKFGEIEIPLLSLHKQQRIVEKIEELFSKLDKGVEELNKIKEQLKIYRQAVFSNIINSYNGTKVKLCDVSDTIDGDRGKNYPKQGEFFRDGYCLFLTAKNVRPFGWKFDDKTFITREKDNVLRNGKMQLNDVVITTRGTLGNVAVYDETVPYENVRINSCMLIIRPQTENITPNFLAYYLMSPMFQLQIEKLKSGTAQPQIPANVLKEIELSLPSIKDQKMIVDKLQEHLSVCDKIEQTVNETLQKAESLRQSILKQAFEGKLV